MDEDRERLIPTADEVRPYLEAAAQLRGWLLEREVRGGEYGSVEESLDAWHGHTN